MRPYISIDIETTGIDDRSEILQISAVIDDLISPIADLPKIDLPILHKSIDYCEPYALGMNADLLKKMMSKEFKSYEPKNAISILLNFMDVYQQQYKTEEGKLPKVLFAGKNVASFDIPKIRKFILKHSESSLTAEKNLQMFDKMIHYKTLDVGSLYFDVFKDNVSLSKINELTGRPAVSHNALDDALDVVYAVRHKLNN